MVPPQMPTPIDGNEAAKIAGEWHGGQSSALYSLASWKGRHSTDTLEGALIEVDRELITFEAKHHDDPAHDEAELVRLQMWLQARLRERACPRCEGAGEYWAGADNPFGYYAQDATKMCPDCKGSGLVP